MALGQHEISCHGYKSRRGFHELIPNEETSVGIQDMYIPKGGNVYAPPAMDTNKLHSALS